MIIKIQTDLGEMTAILECVPLTDIKDVWVGECKEEPLLTQSDSLEEAIGDLQELATVLNDYRQKKFLNDFSLN